MKRGPYQGVWQVFMFNWPFYAWTLAAWLLMAIAFPHPLVLAVSAWWWLASLAVSHYVYDRSDLYRWTWLLPLLGDAPRSWVNVNAGFDETTPALRRLYPTEHVTVLDVYAPDVMTEASIERARRLVPPLEPAIRCHPDGWPLPDQSVEAVFIIFAAHEIRTQEARVRFFAEARRVLVPGGRAVLVEHLRDGWNFLAYGPGFTHFWPASVWEKAAQDGGLNIKSRLHKTPFVGVWVLERDA